MWTLITVIWVGGWLGIGALILSGCVSRHSVKDEWIDPCAEVQEQLEDSDLRAYLADGERDDLSEKLFVVEQGVCGFVKHPHTCRHKKVLVDLLAKVGFHCEQP